MFTQKGLFIVLSMGISINCVVCMEDDIPFKERVQKAWHEANASGIAQAIQDDQGNLVLVDPIAEAVTQAVNQWNEQHVQQEMNNFFNASQSDRTEIFKEVFTPEQAHILAKLGRPKPNPLHQAAKEGDKGKVKELLKKGSVVVDEPLGEERYTALQLAARHGYTEVVAELLCAGANGGCTNFIKKTALHYAAEYGHDQTVQELVKNQTVDVNAISNFHGCTALHLACMRGFTGVARVLFQAGANPEIKDAHGQTAIDIAQASGIAEVFSRSAVRKEGEKEEAEYSRREGEDKNLVRSFIALISQGNLNQAADDILSNQMKLKNILGEDNINQLVRLLTSEEEDARERAIDILNNNLASQQN